MEYGYGGGRTWEGREVYISYVYDGLGTTCMPP